MNETKGSDVAQTILEQLGGNRFAAMIGVRHALARPDGVGIRFSAKAADKINHIEIDLDAGSDTYSLHFWHIPRAVTATPREIVAEHGVHAADLKRLIEAHTGLALSL